MSCAADQRARRDKARKKGICGICTARRAAPGRKSCEVCLERARNSPYIRRRNQKGRTWCMECLAFGFHRADCALTRDKGRTL